MIDNMYKLHDYVLAEYCKNNRAYAVRGFITDIEEYWFFNLIKRKKPVYTIDGWFKTKNIFRKES